MATDEKYLDDLLKSMTGNESATRTMDEVMREMNTSSKHENKFPVTRDELADMLDEIEANGQLYGLEFEDSSAEVPSESVETVPEEILPEPAEVVSDEIPSEILEAISEEIPSEISEAISDEIPVEFMETIPEEVSEEMPIEEVPPVIPEEAVSDEIPSEILETIPEEIPSEISEAISDEIPVEFMETIPEGFPEEIPMEEVPQEIPGEAIPAVTSEEAQEDWQTDIDDLLADAEAQVEAEDLFSDTEAQTGAEDLFSDIAEPLADVGEQEELPDLGMPDEMTEHVSVPEEAIENVPMPEEAAMENISISEEAVAEDDLDITALLDGLEGTDNDLTGIEEPLDMPDDNEAMEDDIEALLAGLDDLSEPEQPIAEQPTTDPIAGQASEQVSEQEAAESGNEEEEGKKRKKKREKKEKKERRKLFGRKKQKEGTGEGAAEAVAEAAEGAVSEPSSQEALSADDLLSDALSLDDAMAGEPGVIEGAEDIPEKGEQGKGEQNKTQKENFLIRFLNFLTREEEDLDQVLDENAEIIKELNEEDDEKAKQEEKKRKKAEKKSKKGKGKKEKKAEGENVDEEGADEEGEEGGKKKKKRVKKEKQPKEKSTEKPVKVLSRKAFLVLVAFCATLIASISILSFFLPDYADKKGARAAFYQGKYEDAYRFLYDKQLTGSDAIIFNRVRDVLKLQRKVDSYENNLALDRKVEALDALFRGIMTYQELAEADANGGREELDQIYQEILALLEQNYQIGETEAMEILAYDDVTYTRKLNSIVYGTEFSAPGAASQEEGELSGEDAVSEGHREEPSQTLQDVLPEEEALIGN